MSVCHYANERNFIQNWMTNIILSPSLVWKVGLSKIFFFSSFAEIQFKRRSKNRLVNFDSSREDVTDHVKKNISHTSHTEVKYSIAGVEFQAAKQFILSSFGSQLYLSWWNNGLRHQADSQKAVGSNPTCGDFFFKCSFFKEFFF